MRRPGSGSRKPELRIRKTRSSRRSRRISDDHVREQAIFALSQLPDERATRALIAAAEDRSLSSEQRKRAVFWLAQSESEGAQTYLEKVLAGNVSD